MKHRVIAINNSTLLFLYCVSVLIAFVFEIGVGAFTYSICLFPICLVVIGLLNGRILLSRYLLLMTIILCLHFAVTPDKIRTLVLCLTTLFLYEAISNEKYNEKVVLYVFLMFFLVGFILTFPGFLIGLFGDHSNLTGYYQSVFRNSNVYCKVCQMTLMCVVLFMKPSKIKLILTLLIIVNIISSGSRNGMLFLITSICFYVFQKSKYAKLSYVLFILFLLMATYYLFFIEMPNSVDFTVMGKSSSAGRATQIRYVINNYPLTLLGCGRDVINMSVLTKTDYPVHNFYINSLYSLGILPFLGYMYYIFRLWKTLPGIVVKSFLLAYNIYFFFEIGICYYLENWTVMPIIILLLSKQLPEGEGDCLKLV